MGEEDIKAGLKVIDTQLKVKYTWIHGWRSTYDGGKSWIPCMMCGEKSAYILSEDEPIRNTFGDVYRGQYCTECAGLDNLQTIEG